MERHARPVTSARFSAIVDRLSSLGVDPSDDLELRLRKGTLTVASILVVVLATAWVGTYLALGRPAAAAVPFAYQVITLVSLAAFARTRAFGPFRASQIALMTFLPFLLQWIVGGFVASSAVGLWSLVAAISAVFFFGAGPAIPWFLTFLVLVVASAVGEPFLANRGPAIPIDVRTAFFALNVGGVSLTAYIVLQFFFRQREATLRALDAAHRESESLLLAILPHQIAERLKERREVIAEAHPAVTVVFADVVDFTPFAERTDAAGVVSLLDDLFSRFDALADQLGLEKIKTIGDAYMVAAGIPEPRPDHVGAAAEMALGMLEQGALCSLQGFPVRLRIGIDTGPAIAGVIGRRKFAYDLWGDTVNTASRMESSGIADRIQVTPAVVAALSDDYEFEARGPVEIKGKGSMATAFLVGRRSPAAGSEVIPEAGSRAGSPAVPEA